MFLVIEVNLGRQVLTNGKECPIQIRESGKEGSTQGTQRMKKNPVSVYYNSLHGVRRLSMIIS